jgi:hypothetical protein
MPTSALSVIGVTVGSILKLPHDAMQMPSPQAPFSRSLLEVSGVGTRTSDSFAENTPTLTLV